MKKKDLELLSAYLDHALSPAEIRQVGQRLQTDPELRATLETLRQTQALLRQMPRRRAPRSFALSPHQVAQRPPLPRFYPFLQWSTALTVFLVVISFVFQFILPRFSLTTSAAIPVEATTEFEAAPFQNTPVPITTEQPLTILGLESTPTPEAGPMIAALPEKSPTSETLAPTGEPTPKQQVMGGNELGADGGEDAVPLVSPWARLVPLARWLGIGLAILAATEMFFLLALRWWSAYQWRKKS